MFEGRWERKKEIRRNIHDGGEEEVRKNATNVSQMKI
jgi:hypothetical protein